VLAKFLVQVIVTVRDLFFSILSMASESHPKGNISFSTRSPVVDEEGTRPGYGQCFEFLSVLRHRWVTQAAYGQYKNWCYLSLDVLFWQKQRERNERETAKPGSSEK